MNEWTIIELLILASFTAAICTVNFVCIMEFI